MTPTSFDFTLTMPGDTRLVDAVRQLAKHAATYAQLGAEAAAKLATDVQRATEEAIAATKAQDAPLVFRFSGDQTEVSVKISCDAPGGSPHLGHVRQPLTA
ncbi:MAG TPA: hypothetical protein VNJ02_09685 [Vicinamibacterales bacterium]|nr:hypothetical protein [Vicinamibacterales bacterium]